MRCRICDEEVDNPKQLSFDTCCTKCVEASSDLYDGEAADEIIVILPDGEEIPLEDIDFIHPCYSRIDEFE